MKLKMNPKERTFFMLDSTDLFFLECGVASSSSQICRQRSKFCVRPEISKYLFEWKELLG